MEPDRIDLLATLLAEAQASGMRVPFLPEPIWRGVAGLAPQLAAELLITRDGTDVLLVWRDDPDFTGWHIPGGFFGTGESVAEAADRIARRELGISVEVDALVDAQSWDCHPYAHAVSLLCACRAEGAPADGTWFTEVPDPVVPYHDGFIRRYLDWLGTHR